MDARGQGPPRPGAPAVGLVAALVLVGAVVAAVVINSNKSSDNGLTPPGREEPVSMEDLFEDADGIEVDPDTGEVTMEVPGFPQPPEPGAPDRHDEPVPCTLFSPEVLDRLGGEVEAVDGTRARDSHPHVALLCRYDGVDVTTYTFEPGADGAGTAAVWSAFEIELWTIPAGGSDTFHIEVADLGDGGGFNPDLCRMVVTHSNLGVRMEGTLGDPRTCGANLFELAEDMLDLLDAE